MKRILLVLLILFCIPLTAAQTLVPATFSGFTETDTASSNFPTWAQWGLQRFWDSPPLQWPSINTASGVFDFSKLDAALAQDYQNGVHEVLYDLWRTPSWATSQPGDTNKCHYEGSGDGKGPGQCYPPKDLNADGSGANAIWTSWVSAIATHVNNADYLNGTGSWGAGGANCPGSKPCPHAHVLYWESINEPDEPCGGGQCFFFGSIAQAARLVEDVNCTVTGSGVVHKSGNGTATPCTSPAIDKTAIIVMPPTHARAGQPITYTQNLLYCNNTKNIPSYQLPCPNPPNALSQAITALPVHMKPGSETGNTCPAPTPCTVESAMAMYAANIRGILQPRELTLPFFDGESSYDMQGFSGQYTNANPGNQASFFPRFYLSLLTQGITMSAFYTSDEISSQSGTVGQTAMAQAASWLTGAIVSPCTQSGSIFSCNLTDSKGVAHLVMYDNSQLCTGSSCPTKNQAVSKTWTTYQDMTTASTPVPISGGIVPLGIKPIVLNPGSGLPSPPTNLTGKVK